jgi:hypothetical protein
MFQHPAMLNVDEFRVLHLLRTASLRAWLDVKHTLRALPRRSQLALGAVTALLFVLLLVLVGLLRSDQRVAMHRRVSVSHALTGHYDVFVAITSTPNHFAERDAARRTWLRYGALARAPLGTMSQRQPRIVHRFFVGVWPDASAAVKRQLEFESRVHRDVVLLDSLDSYERLPFKVISLMQWLVGIDGRNCTIDFVLTTDDDTYVRLDRLHAQLSSAPARLSELIYWGFFNYGSPRTQLPPDVQDVSNLKVQRAIKWSDPLFNGTCYPPYALGSAYALAMPLVSRIVHHYDLHYAARAQVPSRMEDAATGIYLDDAPGRVHRMEIWWRSAPAVKSGSKTTLCEEAMVFRSHVHDLTLMDRWQRNFAQCGRMCACDIDANATSGASKKGKKQPDGGGGVWRAEDDLDYTIAQLKWIGKRKEAELERARAKLSQL